LGKRAKPLGSEEKVASKRRGPDSGKIAKGKKHQGGVEKVQHYRKFQRNAFKNFIEKKSNPRLQGRGIREPTRLSQGEQMPSKRLGYD